MAHTAPIVSGLQEEQRRKGQSIRFQSRPDSENQRRPGARGTITYISTAFSFAMSLPLRPASMKVFPSHRMRQ